MSSMGNVPESVSRDQLEQLVADVGERRSWGFSGMRMVRAPEPWEYSEVVPRFLRASDRVLDIGTGGGERFIALAEGFADGVGIDVDPVMVETACRNRPESLRRRLSFSLMDGQALAFAADSFDVVLSRNAGITPEQIIRVLRPGGYFVGEAVGGRQSQQIFDAFGWGSNAEFFRRPVDEAGGPAPVMHDVADRFARLGCQVVATGECTNLAWFCDIESLVIYLKVAPFPETLDPERHLEAFNRYLAAAAGPYGYETTEHSELVVVRKPD